MGLFGKSRSAPPTPDPRVSALEDQVAQLAARVQTRTDPAPLPRPSSPPPRLLDAAETEAAIAELRVHLIRIEEQLALLDRRITSVGTELAGQLNELGDAINALEDQAAADDATADGATLDGGDAPATPLGAEVLAELRAAQERLAVEQARYQIAFREDLAALADRLPS